MSLGLLESGDAGVSKTLRLMKALVLQYRRDPGVMQLARQLVAGLPQYDRGGEIRVLHAFVRDHIRYTNDPQDMELLQTPKATLEMGTGDCDDKATLLAALLASIGRRTRLVAVALRPSVSFSHVLVEVQHGKGWMPLETIKNVAAGWGPPNVSRRMVCHI